MVEVRFLENGDSPEIGAFNIGMVWLIRADIAKTMIARKQAEEVKQVKPLKEKVDGK